MHLPTPLPSRFSVALRATVRCTVEHAMLDSGRASVTKDSVTFEAHVSDGRVRVVGFPEIEDEVDTVIGCVSAAVRTEGEPEGTHDAETGHAIIEARMAFDPSSFLARTSRVSVTLKTDARLGDPEATGDPLDAGDDRVILVGEGTFDGGSLDGGRLGLVLDAHVTDWSEG